ncbi:Rossmann-fold NAD(P)-binding domain-containing protein [Nocardia macrotermitis]|uniref:Uncharacterized protein n=1 Tax=Nocardia macrotermitis TaxID=2585198 RepID=A0A7K0D7Z4_9NOCA|nr:hypothetical protein [Nocardia macrotermitis]MQY20984.1 hypothetical protein [Nocardia macrotermitis]
MDSVRGGGLGLVGQPQDPGDQRPRGDLAQFAAQCFRWVGCAGRVSNGLRQELAGQHTLVTSVHLGAADTDMMKGYDVPKMNPADVARITLDGVETDAVEVGVDEFSEMVKASLGGDPREFDRRFRQFLDARDVGESGRHQDVHRTSQVHEQQPTTPRNNHEPPGPTSSADETGRSQVASKDAVDLEGFHRVRPGQRSGEGLYRYRGP